ncbi:MAG: NUDIX hydrolase [Hyphomonadaceae bacterium]|nr:NUDIX hydrolase [Hyphomonadaceae bacterium]MBC6412276.1 NUDIX hydrolase [Hyphomonadaceae bacterium]
MLKNHPENPWQIRGDKKIYDNPWIRVTEYDVINPAGGRSDYTVVHFKNVAVGIVAIQDNHIWLVGQTRFPFGDYSWELPKGGSPKGESSVETARRELGEEAGLAAEAMTLFMQMRVSNSVCDERAEIFIAKGLSEVEAKPEDTEDIMVRKVPLQDYFDEVLAGKITDSITVAAAYKLMYIRVSPDS